MHEPERLSSCGLVDVLPANHCDALNAVESFTDNLGFRHATLFGPAFQHALMTRFDIDLFPNHL